MTEQTEGAEVLGRIISDAWQRGDSDVDAILASDWYRQQIAAAEARGAQAVLAAVEKVYAAGPQPNLYLAVDAARAAAAAAGGGGEA